MSTSKFINVDKETGEVLNSFQFTNKQTGFNLKIFKVYDFSTDELLITADGTYNNNLIGYSANSNNDSFNFSSFWNYKIRIGDEFESWKLI